MLLAVISSRTEVDVSGRDVYVSVLGGINYDDPSLDAAVTMALASATLKKKLVKKTAYAGEVDLLGQLRMPERNEQRLDTATKHGFKMPFAETLEELFEEGGLT